MTVAGIWDLDPGPAVRWRDTVAAAQLLRELLNGLRLASWVKTTGGRGLHVVVPIKRSLDWSECLSFSKNVADTMVRANAKLYTTSFTKSGREQKILFDYLRNNRANTSVCAYSPRARAGAPVSMPVDWSDLREPPSRWNLRTARRALQTCRDPWKDYWSTAQRVRLRNMKDVRSL